MSKRLYVGNLSWNVRDEDLREVFYRIQCEIFKL